MSGEDIVPINICEDDAGNRLDKVIASHIDGYSRSFISNLIRKGYIRVNDSAAKPGYCVKLGDYITGYIPQPEPVSLQAEPIELDILYEDRDIIVINKKPGMVVHPAPGHSSGTLVNALLYHCPDIESSGGEARAGIVHRLDKDTSGVIVVAKNHQTHLKLSTLFKSRDIYKEYLAVVYGDLKSESGTIRLPIGRHPTDRKKMSTISYTGRQAETEWRVKERFAGLTLLSLVIKTGRTHQIRIHCACMKHPIIGDFVYGSRKILRSYQKNKALSNLLNSVQRQMLHAYHIRFKHPTTEKTMSFEAPLPEDMYALIKGLREIAGSLNS